jgi:predicted nucleic acid-binding protein
VWIEVFRRPAGLDLESVVAFDEVVTCLPVMHEVLQGFMDERPFRMARDAMRALPIVESPLRLAVVDDAVELYRRARRDRVTVRSSVDCLIAACAIRHDLTVLHTGSRLRPSGADIGTTVALGVTPSVLDTAGIARDHLCKGTR